MKFSILWFPSDPVPNEQFSAEGTVLTEQLILGQVIDVKVSGLPETLNVTPADIETYFEAKGEDIEVESVVNLGGGRFHVRLSGLTSDGKLSVCPVPLPFTHLLISVHSELDQLKRKRHKIKKIEVQVEVQEPPTTDQSQQPSETFPVVQTNQPPVQSAAVSSPDVNLPNVLIVSGPPQIVTKELLEMYFESQRAGSCQGALEECVFLSPGHAQLKFKSPEG